MVPTTPQRGTAGQREPHVADLAATAETRCIPLGDAAFADAVRRMIEEIRASGPAEPRALEARLRREYPRARVVARQVMVTAGSGEMRWYAFRDGTAPPAPLDYE
ncbi:MAG: hypothetical protein FJ038_13400 [Chloroflexi bacterium]|nr:hypothetical protein [Chloroflexota bacterium]